ncbi:MAG: methyl-accepting chemotaxis protein [Syntrophobacteraceae bacterium]
MKLDRLGLGKKLGLGFATVLVISSVIVFVSIYRIGSIMVEVDDLAKVRIPQVSSLYEIMKRYDLIARTRANLALGSTPETMRQQKERYDAGKTEIFKELAGVEKTLHSEKGKEMLRNVEMNLSTIMELSDKAAELGRINQNREAADIIINQIVEPQRKLLELFDSFAQYQIELAETDAQEASLLASHSRLLLMVLGFMALALGTIIAILLGLGITRKLNRVIEGLKEGADQVASASGQVASASQQLAEGSSEQAASLEETSSSLEEMSSMTGQNAASSSKANQLMTEATSAVNKANASMTSLVASMQEVEEASGEIQKIIKTIDGIAFQTNLLALNAAVEAARAGVAGAGFAVVADEVRNLALRAAEAAKVTAGLIEGTVKKVREGSDLVTVTNDEFRAVASTVTKSCELIGEIAAASHEQAQGIEQLNRAISDMDKVTQQNAANAEESASASEQMNSQAEQMRNLVQDVVMIVNGARMTKSTGDNAMVPARVRA